MNYYPEDFGAAGDGKTNDTKSVQAAVDAAFAAGGGRVVLSGGKTYLTESIILKSNIEFHLEAGSLLQASDNIREYYSIRKEPDILKANDVPSFMNCEFAGKPYRAFIYAEHGENIVISGFGVIDGNEDIFHGDRSDYHIEGYFYPRYPVMFFLDIKHLTVRDITIRKSAFWTVHPVGCDDVLFDGMRILNSLNMANCDGLDPDSCTNVRINNCHIECGDDCIVLKTTGDHKEYGPCENITITNCTLISTSSAIKIGTESERDFRNILISNCAITKSHRGISLQLRDGGNIENVIVSGVTVETRHFSQEWWGSAEPFCITALDRKEGVKCGHVKNITVRDLYATSENGILIYGSPDNEIENVLLDNVNVDIVKTSKWDSKGFDLRPNNFKTHEESEPVKCYTKYVKNLRKNGCNF